jgi:hypothetical protein
MRLLGDPCAQKARTGSPPFLFPGGTNHPQTPEAGFVGKPPRGPGRQLRYG